MTSPAIDIQQKLIDEGIQTPIFIGSEPKLIEDDPFRRFHDVVTIYDLKGDPPNPKFNIDNVEIQIRSRSKSYETGYSQLDAIRNKLLGSNIFAINTSFYIGIWVVNDIFGIGQDESNRFIFVLTLRMVRQPDDVGNRLPVSTSSDDNINALFDLFGGPAAYQVYIDNLNELVNVDYPASAMGV